MGLQNLSRVGVRKITGFVGVGVLAKIKVALITVGKWNTRVGDGPGVGVSVGSDEEVGLGVLVTVKAGRKGAGVAGKSHRPGSLPVGVKPTAQRQVLSTSASALRG